MRISMDGRARCLYNVCIKRFRRTIKHEYVYINPESTVGELLRGISKYLDYYNNRRCHQGLAHQTPPPVRYTLRPNEIIGSEEKNNYLSAWKECSRCRDLRSEGSATHKELT